MLTPGLLSMPILIQTLRKKGTPQMYNTEILMQSYCLLRQIVSAELFLLNIIKLYSFIRKQTIIAIKLSTNISQSLTNQCLTLNSGFKLVRNSMEDAKDKSSFNIPRQTNIPAGSLRKHLMDTLHSLPCIFFIL